MASKPSSPSQLLLNGYLEFQRRLYFKFSEGHERIHRTFPVFSKKLLQVHLLGTVRACPSTTLLHYLRGSRGFYACQSNNMKIGTSFSNSIRCLQKWTCGTDSAIAKSALSPSEWPGLTVQQYYSCAAHCVAFKSFHVRQSTLLPSDSRRF